MQTANYQESLAYLYSLQLFGIKLGLENIRELLSRVGNPQEQLRESTLDKLVENLCDQMQAGKLVDLDSLVERYPEMEDRLRIIYPMIQAMANWSDSDSVTGPHPMDHQGLGNREIGDLFGPCSNGTDFKQTGVG